MKPILQTKLKNMFNDQDYMFNLRNISINGRKTGCSGYIYNPSTGLVLYVNTEKSVASWLKETMVRYVSFQEENKENFSKSRFTNGTENINVFCDRNELAQTIVKMLEKKSYEGNEN